MSRTCLDCRRDRSGVPYPAHDDFRGMVWQGLRMPDAASYPDSRQSESRLIL